jgi:hypothetical protein
MAEVEPYRHDMARLIYKQLCEGWRTLTQVRFQLLSFYLTGSAVAEVYVLVNIGGEHPLSANLLAAIAALGLVVSIALAIAEQRNTALHDDMVRRGAKLEDEWGISDGFFRTLRPRSRLHFGVASGIVYTTAIVAWALLLVYALFPNIIQGLQL